MSKEIIYISGPRGSDGSAGSPGPQGPQGPAGDGVALTSVTLDIDVDGVLTDAGLPLASLVRFFGSTADHTIRGVDANPTPGQMHPSKEFLNSDNFNKVWTSEDGTVPASSRVIIPEGATYVQTPNTSLFLEYDYTAQRWRKTPDAEAAPVRAGLVSRPGRIDGEQLQPLDSSPWKWVNGASGGLDKFKIASTGGQWQFTRKSHTIHADDLISFATGGADKTQELKDLISACGAWKNTIKIPEGTYELSDTIIIPPGVVFEGAASQKRSYGDGITLNTTRFIWKGPSDRPMFKVSRNNNIGGFVVSAASGYTLRSVVSVEHALSGEGFGVYVASQPKIHDIQVLGRASGGLTLGQILYGIIIGETSSGNCDFTQIEECTFFGCETAYVYLGTTGQPYQTELINTTFSGIYLAPVLNPSYTVQGKAVHIANASASVIIQSCNFSRIETCIHADADFSFLGIYDTDCEIVKKVLYNTYTLYPQAATQVSFVGGRWDVHPQCIGPNYGTNDRDVIQYYLGGDIGFHDVFFYSGDDAHPNDFTMKMRVGSMTRLTGDLYWSDPDPVRIQGPAIKAVGGCYLKFKTNLSSTDSEGLGRRHQRRNGCINPDKEVILGDDIDVFYVEFAQAEPCSTYRVKLNVVTEAGSPSAGSLTAQVLQKTVNGFFIKLGAAPGAVGSGAKVRVSCELSLPPHEDETISVSSWDSLINSTSTVNATLWSRISARSSSNYTTSGGNVTELIDIVPASTGIRISNSSHKFIQATALNQVATPVNVAALNNKPGFVFSGSQYYVSNSSSLADWSFLHGGSGFTLYAIALFPDLSAQRAWLSTASGTPPYISITYGFTNLAILSITNDTINILNGSASGLSNGVAALIRLSAVDGASPEFAGKISGGTEGTFTMGAVSTNPPSTRLVIGANGGGAQAASMTLAEVAIYKGKTSEGVHRVWESYAQSIYNIAP